MAIELNGTMSGAEIKAQLGKTATKDAGKCLCNNLTTSFTGVSNPICTLGDIQDTAVRHWVSMLMMSIYFWEQDDIGVAKNRILDAFNECNSKIGFILQSFADLLQNNYRVFRFTHLDDCNTWSDIFSSKGAVDDICLFYPLFSIVSYLKTSELVNATIAFGSKIYCVKDGAFWCRHIGDDVKYVHEKKAILGVYERSIGSSKIYVAYKRTGIGSGAQAFSGDYFFSGVFAYGNVSAIDSSYCNTYLNLDCSANGAYPIRNEKLFEVYHFGESSEWIIAQDLSNNGWGLDAHSRNGDVCIEKQSRNCSVRNFMTADMGRWLALRAIVKNLYFTLGKKGEHREPTIV